MNDYKAILIGLAVLLIFITFMSFITSLEKTKQECIKAMKEIEIEKIRKGIS